MTSYRYMGGVWRVATRGLCSMGTLPTPPHPSSGHAKGGSGQPRPLHPSLSAWGTGSLGVDTERAWPLPLPCWGPLCPLCTAQVEGEGGCWVLMGQGPASPGRGRG